MVSPFISRCARATAGASALLLLAACTRGATGAGPASPAPAPAAQPTVTAPETAPGTPSAAPDTPYDVVIRNGRVLDGAGNPWIAADVAIRDGRFAKVGHVPERGRREIDAKGLYVSPGWIDMMDQSGSVLPRNGLAENKLRMGVTTAIGGEGGTPVPASGIPEYFATLERQGISINFGSYFSETQARAQVLGREDRDPNPAELDRMRAIMDTAMRAGAMGMTTALIYPPSSYASTDELVEIAKVAARHGGIYASHIRDEGRGVVTAVKEAIEIGERAGLPVEVFHLKVAYRPGWGVLMDSVRQVVDAARARGVDVAADVYVYTAGGTGLEATIPSWAHEGGRDSLKARLVRPDVRARLKRELVTGSPGWWNIVEAAGGWEGVVLVNARNPANAKYHNRSIARIARETGRDPADVAWDLVAEGQGRVMAIYHMMGEPDIETALRFPWTSIGSDAGAALEPGKADVLGLPHPRSYGNHARVIAKYVKERGVLTLPEAVRKMTSWPATRMRLAGRGTIKEGNWADVTIFDLDSLQDRATYDQPTLSPTGIEWVLVNGEVVLEDGRHTGARPGQVLYGQGWRARGAPTSIGAAGRAHIQARIDSLVQATMDTSRAPGISVAVVHGGDTIVMRGYGEADVENDVPVTPETVFRVGSVTKQFTSAAVMRLVEQGKVSLDAPLSTYLPEYAGPGRDITVHYLLNHTSGIPSYTGLGARWTDRMRLDLPHEELLALFASDSLQFRPGEKWAYNNSGYYLLGMIIERVTGEPYAQHVQRVLTDPLGLSSTLYCREQPIIPHRADGYAVRADSLVNDDAFEMDQAFAAGAMCSTPRDLVRWARALSDGRVVNAASYARMTTPTPLTGGGTQRYGYGLGTGELAGHRKVSHGGGISGFAAQLAHYPADDLFISVLANREGTNVGQLEAKIARVVLGIPEPAATTTP